MGHPVGEIPGQTACAAVAVDRSRRPHVHGPGGQRKLPPPRQPYWGVMSAPLGVKAQGGLMTTETYRGSDERWQRMWSHREQLLRVARRRSMSREDAEDAVHEAMLRAAERPDLDDERLGAWLTTVTMRLCVDRYRQVNREAEVHRSPTLAAPG